MTVTASRSRLTSSWPQHLAFFSTVLFGQSALAQTPPPAAPTPAVAAPVAAATPAPEVAVPVQAEVVAPAAPVLTAPALPAPSEPVVVATPAFEPPPPPAEEPAPTPEFKADEKGFGLTSGGKKPAFAIKFKGLFQVDNRKFLNDDRARDTLLVRRARPIIDGTVIGLVDFRLMPDFSGSAVSLLDAFLDVHPAPWLRLRVGKFKGPVGLERLQSDADMAFIERAITSNLYNNREIGLQLWGEIAGGIVTYTAGVYNGTPDNSNADLDTGAHKDIGGRIFFQPFKAPGLESAGNLGIGVAAVTGYRDGTSASANTQLGAMRSIGQNQIFSYLTSATDGNQTTYAKGTNSRINPQLYYYLGGLGLLGDLYWDRQHVQRVKARKTLIHNGWHVAASYVIGGKNGYDGATPDAAWDPAAGHFGALEIGVRYQDLKLDSDTFVVSPAGAPDYASLSASVERAQVLGFSANWVLSRTFRFMTGFEHSWYKGGRAPAMMGGKALDRKNEDMWISRLQVNF